MRCQEFGNEEKPLGNPSPFVLSVWATLHQPANIGFRLITEVERRRVLVEPVRINVKDASIVCYGDLRFILSIAAGDCFYKYILKVQRRA